MHEVRGRETEGGARVRRGPHGARSHRRTRRGGGGRRRVPATAPKSRTMPVSAEVSASSRRGVAASPRSRWNTHITFSQVRGHGDVSRCKRRLRGAHQTSGEPTNRRGAEVPVQLQLRSHRRRDRVGLGRRLDGRRRDEQRKRARPSGGSSLGLPSRGHRQRSNATKRLVPRRSSST